MALEGLDDIAWSALHDAYGSAATIPDKLRALRHRRVGERRAAIDRLRMGLCPEGVTVSEASAPAVPFLVALARAPEVRDRGAIVALLQAMAEAVSSDDGCARAPSPRAAPLHAAVQAALVEQFDALLAMLSDADSEVRARAALACSALASADARLRLQTVSSVSRVLAHESAADVRVAFLRVLAQHGAREALREALQDRAFPVRLVAALALIRDEPAGSPAYGIVRDALRKLGATEERYAAAARYRPLDWLGDLAAAGPSAAPLFTELLTLLRDSVPARVHVDLAPVLAAFFPRGVPDVPTREQSAVAATVASNRTYFGREAGVRGVLREHGLPDRILPLRRYAARGPADYTRLLPPPLRQCTAREVFERAIAGSVPGEVRDVDLVGDATDEVLAMLGKLPLLRQLLLKSSAVGPIGFFAIAALPALQHLELEDLTLARASAVALAKSESLRSLTLVDVTLELGALPALCSEARLTFLCLRGITVGAADFSADESTLRTLFFEDGGTLDGPVVAQLARLSALEHVRLADVEATPAALDGLHAIASLRNLALVGREIAALPPLPEGITALSLARSKVAATALQTLLRYPALARLDLEGVPLNDEHVEALMGCVGLKALRVSMASLHDAAAQRLQQALPGLSLTRV